MNHQNQMFNHPREICTTQREDGKVLFKARNAARYLGHAGSDIALPENGKTVGPYPVDTERQVAYPCPAESGRPIAGT